MTETNFRAAAPAPTEPRPYRFPDVIREELPNGLRLLMAPTRGAGLITVRAVVHAGADHDPADKPGLAVFTGEMLEEGAAGKSSMDIAELVATLGAALFCGADWDASLVSVDSLAKHLERSVGLLADLMQRPEFPAHELERMRGERLTAIRQQKDDPAVVAGQLFNRFIFGSAPYGNPSVGTEESVTAFQRSDVESFYARHYAPNNTSIVLTGELDPKVARGLVERAFSAWERKARAEHEPPTAQAAEGAKIFLIDRPSSVQSEVRVGHVGVPRSSEDYFPLVVMNAILGGVFTSRLNLNLRERHAFTYGIRSAFAFRKFAGPFVVSTAVRNEVTPGAIREILAELRAIREGELGDEEMAVAKNYLEGVFPATVESAHDLAARVQEMELYGLPNDYFDSYRERILAVDAEAIRRVAVKYLDPDRVAIVVVGKASDIHEPLRALEHPIGLYDIEGRSISRRTEA
ncbi:MAG TPA: pitrilysin family protein [Thermoanaerobaculia bacterium]|nr:pitrilysin family protein [Thermoanaerobaculia bacterium]